MQPAMRVSIAALVATVSAAAFGMASLSGQAAKPAARTAKPWTLERTPDGKPDLQGTWTNATITPLERPASQANLMMTPAEAARLEKMTRDRVERLGQDSDPNRPAPPKGGDGSTGAAGNVGGYNNFWLDPGERVAMIDGQYRSSLIIDPPDGKLPALTQEARTRNQERLKMMMGRGQYDQPEFRPLAERCLLSFGPTTPLVPNYFYNNNLQIVQSPDAVMILMEMVHDARIVRMNAKHVAKHIRPWMGDSIGTWEGDTLVVDTTNFNDTPGLFSASRDLHVIERFTRLDANTLSYQFTVEDPAVWAKPWSGEVVWPTTDQRIFEYACHEGNYSFTGILKGARVLEAEALKKLSK